LGNIFSLENSAEGEREIEEKKNTVHCVVMRRTGFQSSKHATRGSAPKEIEQENAKKYRQSRKDRSAVRMRHAKNAGSLLIAKYELDKEKESFEAG